MTSRPLLCGREDLFRSMVRVCFGAGGVVVAVAFPAAVEEEDDEEEEEEKEEDEEEEGSEEGGTARLKLRAYNPSSASTV